MRYRKAFMNYHQSTMRRSMKGARWIIYAHMLLIALLVAGCSGSSNSGSNEVVSLSPGASATESLQIDTPNLQLNGTANVTATFRDLSGVPISGVHVNFTTSFGSLNPSSGAAVTDATGNATVQLMAGNSAGTGIVTASATVSGVTITKVVGFSVAFPAITLSTPVLGIATPLAPGGSTSVTVSLTDSNGQPFTTPVDVSFSSNFSSTGKATLISPVRSVVTTVGGVTTATASTTYTATGGVGTDTITVSAGSATKTVQITVSGAAANSISFVSATPTSIALKGTGGAGRSETSTVVFKVLDTNGQPKQGQQVDFALNTTVGGLALTSSSASSAVDGTVSTIVLSGIVATPVRVTASIHGSSPLIATQSDQLVVSTGIPAQNGMSLAVVTHNVEAYNTDGVSDVFTVYLADHFGNPVPDGTAVNFSAQVGQIQPSCTTVNGRCSATWTSSGVRTADGRAAILAYAIGEESFTDTNGNGFADGPDQATCLSLGGLQTPVVCGEFTDTTQAWRDDAHTGAYAPQDFFIDFNGSGKVDRDGVYNGILTATTPQDQRSKHVFANNVIVMSTSEAVINDFDLSVTDPTTLETITPINPATSSNGTTTSSITRLKGSVQDENANPVASGTQIAISSQSTCLTVSPASFVVPNTLVGPTGFTTVVTNSCLAGIGSPGYITVNVTSPAGLVSYRTFKITW